MSAIYRVEENDIFGRYLVAGRCIKQGELILKDNPVILGPLIEGCVICFSCSKLLRNIEFTSCMKCKKAIVCSPKCKGKFHSNDECTQLQQSTITQNDIIENSQIITPLRCLLLRNQNPEIWCDLMKLESHIDKRKNTMIWRKHKFGVEDVLNDLKILNQDDLDLDLVQKICGILDVNTFEVRSSQNRDANLMSGPEYQCLRGLYLKAALMAHDCIANTHISVNDNYDLSIHASMDIPENEIIYFNYANALQDTFERKRHLREGKYFECFCRRCNDPTELQTELSTLVCPRCRSATLRPMKPGTKGEFWQCSTCQRNYKDCLIKATLRECKRRIYDTDPSNVKSMENLLKKLLLTLNPQHYLILELKENLVGAYTHWIPSQENLMRKAELCEQLMSVFKIIEPGISRMQAITLYELHSVKTTLAHKQYSNKQMKDEEFISCLIKSESILKDAIKFLLYEPVNSPEGTLVQTAMRELKALRNSIIYFQQNLLMKTVENDNKDTIIERKQRRKKNKNKK